LIDSVSVPVQTPPTDPVSSEPDRDLQRRLLWLMGMRLVLGTLLMGATVLYQVSNSNTSNRATSDLVFWLVGSLYLLTLFYSLVLPRVQRLRMFATLQLCGDLLLISVLVVATGSQDSLFLFCYLLVIIGASNLLSRRDAFMFALGSWLLLALILTSSMFGLFESISTRAKLFQYFVAHMRIPYKLYPVEFFYIMVVYGSAFFLIAFLSSHLVEQVRYTGEIIQQQQINIDNLEALHYDIVTSLPSGLLTTDSEHRIRSLNQSASEMLGMGWQEVYGRKVEELLTPLKEHDEWMSAEESTNLEFPIRTRDGERRYLVLTVSPLRDRHHTGIGRLILLQDLTRLKDVEAVAARNERLAAIGQLAGGLAHEIRNPLAALSGSIQLLKMTTPASDEDEALMNIVVRETDRLNGLLTDFLSFARPREPQPVRSKVIGLLKETIFLLTQDHRYQNINVRLNVPPLCQIDVDSKLFHQVCWNLLINASQAMQPEGGELLVEAFEEEGGTWFCVTDSGPGISPELQEKIFNPFFSTKDGGTGLGLAVVQRIVVEHQGEIEIHSKMGTSTQFRLFFPLHGPEDYATPSTFELQSIPSELEGLNRE
jgi:two-component system sensor histidine kinase PilS (NtrC family)